MTSQQVTIFEVGPRDGLQNLKQPIPTPTKIALVDALSGAGFSKIETTSFVNPKWVPQLSDGPAVMSGIKRDPAIAYAALTPNLKGVEAAIAGNCDEVAVVVAASEGFSHANLNCSIADNLAKLRPAIDRSLEAGIPVRGYLSCVVECPFDGFVRPEAVAELTSQLIDFGCYEISLCDTIGTAPPEATARLLDAVLVQTPASKVAGHFHDTHGFALRNIETSLDHGLRVFDSSVSGLGGCPYAPGASGNVDTRTVVEHLKSLGFETGIDLHALALAEQIALNVLEGENANGGHANQAENFS